MEDFTRITEQANKFIDQIQKQMRLLETGQALKAQAEQPSLSLVFRDRGEDIPLEGFLYPEQLGELKQTAVAQVEARMGDAAALLGQMVRGDAEPAKPEKASTSKSKAKKEVAKGNPRKSINGVEVQRLFEEGKAAKEIAQITGFTCSGIMTYLSRHGIKRQPGKPPEQEGFRGDNKTDDEGGVPAVDDDQERLERCEEPIRESYETGIPLKRLAEEYGVSKRVMYDFIQKNHMRRSVN